MTITPKHTIEPWSLRRGTEDDNHYQAPASDCVILNAPDHFGFGYIIVRMEGEERDDPDLLARANLAASTPDLLAENDRLKEANAELEAGLEKFLQANETVGFRRGNTEEHYEAEKFVRHARAAIAKATGAAQ